MTDSFALTPDQLARTCEMDRFTFDTTAEIQAQQTIFGQPRGVEAIEFGVGIDAPGYNVYVLGPSGSGRQTAVRHFIHEQAARMPEPDDWCYVFNFQAEHQPATIHLPAGQGPQFQDDMAALVDDLHAELKQTFDNEPYAGKQGAIIEHVRAERERLLGEVDALAASLNCTVQPNQQGYLVVIPLLDGEPMEVEHYETLPDEERTAIDANRNRVDAALDAAFVVINRLQREANAELDALRQQTATGVIQARIEKLLPRYDLFGAIIHYLRDLRADLLENLDEFLEEDGPDDDNRPPRERIDFKRRYSVNVLVTHTPGSGAPVVTLDLPTYRNLVGRIEQEVLSGMMSTDFTLIKAGALHRANGGFLIVRAEDLLNQGHSWEALIRAMLSKQIVMEDPGSGNNGIMTTRHIDPLPVPLSVKVVLLGSSWTYYWLHNSDENFPDLFRVKADFADEMPRTPENERNYAEFVAARCHEARLPHFNREAVGRIVEYGSWLISDQERLSVQFGQIVPLLHESVFFARRADRSVVTAEDVEQAISARTYRSNELEELSQDSIARGEIFIDVQGEVVGQINALVVINLGDHEFGLPSRLTAQVYMGREAVVQIDRESRMTGPIHDKGVMILQGYLGGNYAQDYPLALTASLSFEQNYVGLEGDSASSAELYALLSALANMPLRQDIAVTGSVNQRGQIQPIGGATQKIEGFFNTCKKLGLTGTQGVIVPRSNLRNLMLNHEVRAAVAAGKFHVYAVDTVEDGMQILTGATPDKVQKAVDRRLRHFANRMMAFEGRQS